MFVSFSATLIYSSVGNIKSLRSCICHAVKNYVILSPNLNPGFPKGISARLISQSSPKLCIFDAGDDDLEKEESKYLYQPLSHNQNIDRITACIGGSRRLAVTIIRDYPEFRNITSKEIKRIIWSLNEKGISMETISENHWFINIPQDTLEETVGILAKLGVTNFNLAVSLFRIPIVKLRETFHWCLSEGAEDKTKISYLCDKLKCDPADIVLAASMHIFLRNLPFERITAVLTILLEEGVPPSNILRDIWVLRYRVEQVQRRVKQAKEGKVKQFKTWMVRCKEEVLRITIRIEEEERTLLGPYNYSTLNYISSRLKMNPGQVKIIFKQHPQLKGVGAAKLCSILDFLLGKEDESSVGKSHDGLSPLNKGEEEMGLKFDPILVWNSSRILCHSLCTMKTRLATLRALDYEPKTPVVLYMAKRKFKNLLKNLEEKNLGKSQKMKNLSQDCNQTSIVSKTSINS